MKGELLVNIGDEGMNGRGLDFDLSLVGLVTMASLVGRLVCLKTFEPRCKRCQVTGKS